MSAVISMTSDFSSISLGSEGSAPEGALSDSQEWCAVIIGIPGCTQPGNRTTWRRLFREQKTSATQTTRVPGAELALGSTCAKRVRRNICRLAPNETAPARGAVDHIIS